ncbi:MAG TPA: ROK family protein [Thermoanaerobaculia bacterium]|jgi:fructokinase
MGPLYAGIEAGGTKFVCAVGSGPDDLRAEARFPTTTPEETLGRVIDFFRRQGREHGRLDAVGIASFGPVDLDRESPSWGHLTSTPKPGWAHTDLAGIVGRALELPVAFDTDVNGAALAEGRWGAARGLATFVYVTVGTGIGGGAVVDGELLHGLVHPEMGHMLVPHDRDADPFAGQCPYHGDCLEGLASGPAIAARWGRAAHELPDDHPAWDLEAEYLAAAAVNLTVVLSPQRVVLGGGVMERAQLYPKIRRRTRERLNGYVRSPAVVDEIDAYIVPPALGKRAGVLGALALAARLRSGARITRGL